MSKVWTPVPDGMYIGKTTRDSDFEVDGAWLRTYYRGAKGWGCKIPTERGWQLCHLVEQPLSLRDRPDMPDAPAVLTDDVRATIEGLLLQEREEFEYAASKSDEWLSSADERKRLSIQIAVERVTKIDAALAWLAELGQEGT